MFIHFQVLQNHQQTTELEYQSKQTEKLFFKNQKLIEQVKAQQRDVEIHKQVESELAKRSHFCQKQIKKLNSKIKEFDNQTGEYKTSISNIGILIFNNGLIERNIVAKEKDKQYKKERQQEINEEQEKFDQKMTQYKGELAIIKEENIGLNKDYKADLKKYGQLLKLLENSSLIFKRRLGTNQEGVNKDLGFNKDL